jgi:hypothetical protein
MGPVFISAFGIIGAAMLRIDLGPELTERLQAIADRETRKPAQQALVLLRAAIERYESELKAAPGGPGQK